VVLAFTALEALLNELRTAVGILVRGFERNDVAATNEIPESAVRVLRSFHGTISAPNYAFESIETRYDDAFNAFSGSSVNRGSGSRQALGVLATLRNALVHLESQEIPITADSAKGRPPSFPESGTWQGLIEYSHLYQPPFMCSLENWRLVERRENRAWTDRVRNQRVAAWACDTVERSAQELTSKFPALLRNELAGGSLSVE
jgi:hypothetical protein